MVIWMKDEYYVYAYLREDGTPYYIGKGKGNRAFSFSRKNIKRPPTNDRIYIPISNLTEQQAFEAEKFFIAKYGRKDNNTGILHNKSDGGEGAAGVIFNEERRKSVSLRTKDRIGINNGIRNRFIKKNTKIPRGWKKGILISDSKKEKISSSSKQRWKNLSEEEKKEWKEKIIFGTKNTPRKPQSREQREETKKRFKNSIYITNGIDNKRIKMEEKIPDGWVKGRITKTPRSKETIEKQRETIKNTLAKKRKNGIPMRNFDLYPPWNKGKKINDVVGNTLEKFLK